MVCVSIQKNHVFPTLVPYSSFLRCFVHWYSERNVFYITQSNIANVIFALPNENWQSSPTWNIAKASFLPLICLVSIHPLMTHPYVSKAQGLHWIFFVMLWNSTCASATLLPLSLPRSRATWVFSTHSCGVDALRVLTIKRCIRQWNFPDFATSYLC